MINIVDKIGLEWEFFIRDRRGELIYPGKIGLEHDDFPIIGEARALPGTTVHETVGSFISSLVKVRQIVARNKCTLHTDIIELTLPKYAEIVRVSGTKAIPDKGNIYNTEILALPEDIRERNGVPMRLISAGLHIHFSSNAECVYQTLAGNVPVEKKEHVSLLTTRRIKSIIRALDRNVLPQFPSSENVRFRQPGYFEWKPWGFEYRSLPMLECFFAAAMMTDLVETCFMLLEKARA